MDRRQPFRYAPERPTTGKVRVARYPPRTQKSGKSCVRTVLVSELGDYASNDSDWARLPTLLNAEPRGIHGRVCFCGSRWQGEVERAPHPPLPLAQIRPPCDSTID